MHKAGQSLQYFTIKIQEGLIIKEVDVEQGKARVTVYREFCLATWDSEPHEEWSYPFDDALTTAVVNIPD